MNSESRNVFLRKIIPIAVTILAGYWFLGGIVGCISWLANLKEFYNNEKWIPILGACFSLILGFAFGAFHLQILHNWQRLRMIKVKCEGIIPGYIIAFVVFCIFSVLSFFVSFVVAAATESPAPLLIFLPSSFFLFGLAFFMLLLSDQGRMISQLNSMLNLSEHKIVKLTKKEKAEMFVGPCRDYETFAKLAKTLLDKMVQIPGRKVMLTSTVITQKEWNIAVKENPSLHVGEDLPVENLSWDACLAFIGLLNETSDRKFRLPTAEEWELCCRAGSTGEYGLLKTDAEGQLSEIGWYKENSNNATHPVMQKEPNAWGFYDMHGNVQEWTSDEFRNFRMTRGGSFKDTPAACSASSQAKFLSDYRSGNIGFRLAVDPVKVIIKTEAQISAEAASSDLEKITIETSPQGILKEMVQIPGKKFKLGRTMVTQGQWTAIMGDNPSSNKGDLLPVENVSLTDCLEFIEKINNATGQKFRLPTQEEWEISCLAGGTGAFGLLKNGAIGELPLMGWNCDNSGNKTHPVAQKKPNAWGLYDMHGNVWEWTDTAMGANFVLKGGCYDSPATKCTTTSRGANRASARSAHIGFRLALSNDAKPNA